MADRHYTFTLEFLEQLKLHISTCNDTKITYGTTIVDWTRAEVQDLLAKYDARGEGPPAITYT